MNLTLTLKNLTKANTTSNFWIVLFGALIVVAEALVAYIGAIPGVILDAILIFVLLNNYLFRKSAEGQIYLVLALLPLLRIFSLVVPVVQVPQIFWYAMAGIPILLAAGLTARLVKPSRMEIRMDRRTWAIQGVIAISGLPLAVIAYLVLKPVPLTLRLNWQEVLIGSLILILFSGFLEELIFRAMLQPVMEMAFGRYGLLLSSILYACMFLGSLSPGFVFFMGLVGLFFGYLAKRSGSIWGIVIAHSILSIGLIWILPVLW